ncbi:MAG TPA: hypothetical protein VGH19_23380 [Verrucomicrobiae bacterium]
MSKDTISNIEAVVRRLESGDITEAELEEAIKSPIESGMIAEEIYLLVSILAHERRQLWVGHIVESRLHAQGAELGTMGAVGHPQDMPQSGDVPGENGWRYYFHGRGCCFTHEDKTEIDVDFADDGTALEIDPYFYRNYLKSSPSLSWFEQKLIPHKKLDDAWMFDLKMLRSINLIQDQHRFRLTDTGRSLAAAFEALLEKLDALPCAARSLLFVSIADWQEAANQCKQGGLQVEKLTEKSEAQRTSRLAQLRATVNNKAVKDGDIALASLGAFDKQIIFHDVLTCLRQKPASNLNHTALTILNGWQGPEVVDILMENIKTHSSLSLKDTFTRWTSKHLPPQEYSRLSLIVSLTKNLLEKCAPDRHPSDLIPLLRKVLAADFACHSATAAFLLYLIDPNVGLIKLSAGLSDHIPINRQYSAAFLAIIGNRHSVDILIQGTKLPPELGGHESASALVLIKDIEAQAAGKSWSRQNNGYESIEGKEVEIMGRKIMTWSFDEIERSNLREMLKYEYEAKSIEFGPLLSVWRSSSSA